MTEVAEITTRLAPSHATTWDAEAWTFEAVLSAGSVVERIDFQGAYDEILSLSQAWPEMVPLLDSHRRASVDDRLGGVDRMKTVGGELRGRVTLSRHNPKAQRIAAELTDGQTFGVSIGYVVRAWSERTNPKTKRREKIATAFDLVEASLVVIPADRRTGIRGSTMTETTATADAPGTTTPAVTPANPTPEPTTDRAAVNNEIRTIARIANLDQTWIDGQIDASATVETAQRAAFDVMRSRTTPTIRNTVAEIGTDYTDPAIRARAMGEALFARATPGHTPSDAARPFMGLSTVELARDCLRHAGVPTTGLSPSSIIERGLHTTSDFPLVFGDTVNRTLRAAYAAAPSGIRQLARQSSVRDFRTKSQISLSNAFTLEKVTEHGEFRSGTFVEAAESYAADTFGKLVGVTRQMLVNDDLGAFHDLSARLGQAAAAFEAEFLLKRITDNPLMRDGKAVFHADHRNLAASAAALSETSLSAARLALRQQTDPGGGLISVTPKFLLVGPEIETAAEKLLAAITPTRAEDANPFSGTLTLVVEPRMTGRQWYVTASPAEVPSLEYSYLEGEPGPQVAQEIGFEVDGVRFRVRLDYGAGWLDHRGWFRNAGA